jgi:hypothetical protein
LANLQTLAAHLEIRLRVNEDHGTQMYTTKKPEASAMMSLYQINFAHAALRPT